MKVLAFTSYSDRAEQAMFIGLHRAGVHVDVVAEPDAPAGTSYEEAGMRVTRIAVRRRVDLAAFRSVGRLVAAGDYDIVHMMTRRALRHGIPAARRSGAALVAYRGVRGRLHPWNPADRSTYLHPDVERIVCVSQGVRASMLEERWPGRREDPARLVTIHKGHDVSWYDVRPVDRDELGVPPEAFLVAFVANLRDGKAHEDVLIAFEGLPPGLRAHLVMVGKGTDAPEVRRRIAASPAEARIHAIGYREAAVPYTAAADTLVLPSRAEGLSKVIIEAMACRVPPVVTPAGGGELVRHGIDGLVVPYGAPDELSHAIQQMAEDRERRKAMGEAAHRRIETDFSVEETVRKTRALYEELRLARRRPSAEVRSPDRSRTTGE